MIVPASGLAALRGRVAMVDGAFDPLHAGHVAYLRAAAELGAPVLCALAPDAYVARKHVPLLPQAQRAAVLDALRDVAYVHPSTSSTAAVLAQLRPRYYVKGTDWQDRLPAEELATCAEHAIEIVYLDTVTQSSSRILADFIARQGERTRA
jgi:cytidyltransferase-like protein